MKLRIGTRGSRLALIQAEEVAAALRAAGASVDVEVIKTSGDRLAQVTLADFGGKALFVKEIEEALLSRRVDVGVHSLKDMPTVLPAGLLLAAFPRREDPRDVLVSRSGAGWDALPAGAVIGTSSPRRCALVLARRPDLDAQPIRGNVETRLEKLRAGGYEALVLAAAGLARLQIDPPGTIFLDPEEFVPAAGQGLLAVEARETDREVLELLSRLDDTRGRSEALAERAVLARLGADCHTPVAAHGRLAERQLRVTGLVASIDGRTVLRAALAGPAADSIALGTAVADDLLAKGAKALLDASRK